MATWCRWCAGVLRYCLPASQALLSGFPIVSYVGLATNISQVSGSHRLRAGFFHAATHNVNSGATVQWQSTLWNRLHLLAGLRLGLVDMLGTNPFAGTQFHTEAAKVLPRAGVAYDLLPGVTLFSGYSEGLCPVRFFAGTGAPRPEEASQLEAGMKLVLPFGFSGTLAAFDITRRNVVSNAPDNPFMQLQTGEQRSRGFDADLTWRPIAGLSMIASYAHIDAEITKDEILPVGNRLDRVPKNSGRVWVNYKVQGGWLKNVSVGAGLYAASSQAIALDNQFFTPAFITLDAKVSYDTDSWSIALIGKNVTNRQYLHPVPLREWPRGARRSRHGFRHGNNQTLSQETCLFASDPDCSVPVGR